VRARKGTHAEALHAILARGYVRARVDGEIVRLDGTLPRLDRRRRHTVEIAVDRIRIEPAERQRITDSVELALRESRGEVVLVLESGVERAYSEKRTHCGHAFLALEPRSFSFNSPLGFCPECNGLGIRLEMDPDLVVPDTSLSVNEGAIEPLRSVLARDGSWNRVIFDSLAEEYGIDLDRPWARLPRRHRDILLSGADRRVEVAWEGENGSGSYAMRFEGVLNTLYRRYEQTRSEGQREHYRRYLSQVPCSACSGTRLRAESRAVLVHGRSITDLCSLPVHEALSFLGSLDLAASERAIAAEVLKEIRARLRFLCDVGLGYLTLDRSGPSLSGGEAQRIRLASQVGSELSGVTYVLDEPSIGLHARDMLRLVATLTRPRSAPPTTSWTSAPARGASADGSCSRAPRRASPAPGPPPGATSRGASRSILPPPAAPPPAP
jgi:excinuclease ABC subunit A